MFQRITIELTGPICSCEKRSISWGCVREAGGYGMVLTCKTCGTELRVPHEKFVARFHFDDLEDEESDDSQVKDPDPDFQDESEDDDGADQD